MSEIASAFVSLVPSARGFGSKLESQVGGEVNSSGKRLGGSFGKVFAGAAAALGGAVVIGGFLKDSIAEAREAQKVGALTASTIKATGGAANVTAKQVGDLASALSLKTGIDDETIQSGENMLLTFKNIRNEAGKGNDIFSQSTKTLVDLSAAMGTEPKQAAIQLGKALNDPIKGVTALSRVGVTFTDGQKQQIKTLVEGGRTMDAQKIILKELNSEFGGAAEAQATAGDKAKVAFGNIKEAVGTALLPAVDAIANAFVKATPTILAFVDNIGPTLSKIGGYIAPVVDFVKKLFGSFSSSEGGGKLEELRSTFSSVFGSIKDIVKSYVDILTTLWDAFGSTLITYVSNAFSNILDVIRGGFKIVQGIFKVISSLLKGDWQGVWDGIKMILSGAWTVIQALVRQGWNVIKTSFSVMGTVVKGIFGRLWDGIKTLASNAWDNIRNLVSRGIAAVVSLIKALPGKARSALSSLTSAIGGVVSSAFENARNLVNGGAAKIVDAVRAIPGKLRALGSLFASAGHAIIDAFVNGLRGAAGLVSDIAGNVWSAVKGLLNDAISKINAALEFTISLPGPDVHINAPNIPYLAKGGPAQAGRPYIVGEVGPELFVPNQSGRVIPNNKLSSAHVGLGGDDAVLTELRLLRKAVGVQGREFGREINGALAHGRRRTA